MNTPSPDLSISSEKPAVPSRLKVRLSAAWRDSLLVFLIGRVFYSLIGAGIWLTRIRPPEADQFYYGIPPVLDGWAGMLLGVWQRWDALHYQNIALNGYISGHLTAFFPLYPLLGGSLHHLTGLDILTALILVSNLAFLYALVVMHKLVSRVFPTGMARTVLVAIVIFPTGFFFYAIYPQSLLLLFVVGAVDLAMRRKWIGAAAVAFLAGLTHPSALFLSVPIAIEAWQYLSHKSISIHRLKAEWPVLLAPTANLVAIGGFMIWRQLAGFPAYSEIQNQNWQRGFFPPWQTARAIVSHILSTPLELGYLATWINIGVFILVLALTLWSVRKIPAGFWLFQVAFIWFLLTNYQEWNPLLGFFRYTLVVFPLFIELASVFTKSSPALRLLLFSVSLILALMTSALFFMWQGGVS